jgi:DNA-binding CsgD family transcriptional regulator
VSRPPLAQAVELRLTGRERDVLELLAGGLRQEQVAARLGIGSETVRTHVRNACERLGAATATQAVAIAIRQGLIAV